METEEKTTEEHKELLEQDISDYFMMEVAKENWQAVIDRGITLLHRIGEVKLAKEISYEMLHTSTEKESREKNKNYRLFKFTNKKDPKKNTIHISQRLIDLIPLANWANIEVKDDNGNGTGVSEAQLSRYALSYIKNMIDQKLREYLSYSEEEMNRWIVKI